MKVAFVVKGAVCGEGGHAWWGECISGKVGHVW